MGYELSQELASFGYVAVLVLVGLEYTGIPLPGETALVGAAILAANGTLSIGWVWACGCVASIVGATLGYAIGRQYGLPLALKYGSYIHLDEGRLKIGQYLFQQYGFAIIFLGRFVALLRALSAFLAGVNRFDRDRFLVANVLGGVAWASLYAFGGYLLGEAFERYARPVAISVALIVVIVVIATGRAIARLEPVLRAKAEAAIPGPLKI